MKITTGGKKAKEMMFRKLKNNLEAQLPTVFSYDNMYNSFKAYILVFNNPTITTRI